MNKKKFIKSAVAVACLVFASMFGFKTALGYGGGAITSTCSSVTYGEWGECVNGMQYRDVISQTPNYCKMTVSQQLERSRSCGAAEEGSENEEPEKEVLGEKTYADGTLLRGSDKKVYLVINGKLKHLASLKELSKYAGKEIKKVSDEIISSMGKISETGSVLGEKKYGNGQLIRNDNVKVYVIENGKKKHILNLEELAKYYLGKPIYRVTETELAEYEETAR